MHPFHDLENNDKMIVTGASGGVRGMYTYMEAIVLRGDGGELWVAFIDNDVVRYFTTQADSRQTLPQTIEGWRVNFADKEVIFGEHVNYIPKLDV